MTVHDTLCPSPKKLEIGGHHLSGPVSLQKSLQAANEMLAKHGLAESIQLEEGSGISRGNRVTARGLAELLHLFEPDAIPLRPATAPASRPVPFPASALWRAMPTPQSMDECVS